MIRTRDFAAVLLILLTAGCVQTPSAPDEPLAKIEAPAGGALAAAYDQASWRWVRNRDGRALLTHTQVQQCFIDPQPPLDFHDSAFTLKRGEKTIGAARYEVVSVFEQQQFWEAIYTRAGSKQPLLSVYADGRCMEEAERVLATYEKGLTPASK